MKSQKVYRQWSKCRLVFHRHHAYVTRDASTSFKLDTKDVIRCQLTKELGQAAGGFSASLVPRQDYLENIKPNDWVEIFLDAEGPEEYPVMVCSVDRISRTRVVEGSGSTRESINISGRDYGKVFLNIMLIMDPLLGALIDQTTFTQEVLISKYAGNDTPLVKSDEVVKNLLERYHNSRVQAVLPATLKSNLGTYRKRIVTGDDAGELNTYLSDKVQGRLNLPQNVNLGGNLWSCMEQYVNPTLNEMWVDTEGGVPTLHLEERPFSHDQFADLDAIEVFETEVVQEDLGKSDQDVRNWIRVYPDADSGAVELANIEGIGYGSKESIARSGLKKFESTTNSFGDFKEPIIDLLQRWSGILAEWNAHNEELLSGTMTTRLRPDARIGRRMDYTNERTNERLSFYIEGVTHSFSYPGASTTSFQLTRGVVRERDEVKFPLLKVLDEMLFSGEVQELNKFNFLELTDATVLDSSKGTA